MYSPDTSTEYGRICAVVHALLVFAIVIYGAIEREKIYPSPPSQSFRGRDRGEGMVFNIVLIPLQLIAFCVVALIDVIRDFCMFIEKTYEKCKSLCCAKPEPISYYRAKPVPTKQVLKDTEDEWEKTAKMWEDTVVNTTWTQSNIPEEEENMYEYTAHDCFADIYQEYFENMVGCDDIDLTWESTKELTMKPVARATVITPRIKHMYKVLKHKVKGLFA